MPTSATPLHPADKPLDRMDRLADMLHFPAAVNAGASANIVLTIVVIYLVQRWLPASPLTVEFPITLPSTPLLFAAVVIALNVVPVVLLRASGFRRETPMPTLERMSFLHDQHRFSDWVYLAASANMAFWILLAWCVLLFEHTLTALFCLLAVAFVVTFSPVLFRRKRSV